MKNAWPVYRRELRAQFLSPIAYVVAAFFLLLAGYFFATLVLAYADYSQQAMRFGYLDQEMSVTEWVFGSLVSNLAIVLIFMVPMLTMRLFSEEKKTGTIELLFTYPVTDREVILGKFAAVLTFYLVMLAITLAFPLYLSRISDLALGPIFAGYLGLILFGAACLACGVFASSLTSNQIVAAAVTFGILLFVGLLAWSVNVSSPVLKEIITHLSLLKHVENFGKGVLDTRDVVYLLNFTFVFLFLTARTLESKKWRG
jgi:ABC-2 type transport system permease protein